MNTAIYPGTFDPITHGHIDVIKKSLNVFDRLIVATTDNINKNYHFSIEDRISIINDSLFKDLRFSKQKIKVVSFDNLTIEFLVDENLENWRELYDWMRTIYLVDDYKNFESETSTHFTEGSILLLNSAMNVNKEIRFHNLLPISLSGIDFDSTDTDLSPRSATATFDFDFYEFL